MTSVFHLTSISLPNPGSTNVGHVLIMGKLILAFGMKDLHILTLPHTSLKFWLKLEWVGFIIHSLSIEHLLYVQHTNFWDKVISKAGIVPGFIELIFSSDSQTLIK